METDRLEEVKKTMSGGGYNYGIGYSDYHVDYCVDCHGWKGSVPDYFWEKDPASSESFTCKGCGKVFEKVRKVTRRVAAGGMHLSWELESGQRDSTELEVKHCTATIGGHCVLVKEINGELVVSYYYHRLEVGPEPGDKEVRITGLNPKGRTGMNVQEIDLYDEARSAFLPEAVF